MLTQEQAEKLRLLLFSGGWNEVMRPAIENRLRSHVKKLTLWPSERKAEDQDDTKLRAQAEELQWMLSAFENELKVEEYNRQVDELHRQTNGIAAVGSELPANPG